MYCTEGSFHSGSVPGGCQLGGRDTGYIDFFDLPGFVSLEKKSGKRRKKTTVSDREKKKRHAIQRKKKKLPPAKSEHGSEQTAPIPIDPSDGLRLYQISPIISL